MISGDRDRGIGGPDISEENLFTCSLLELRKRPQDLLTIEAERRLDLARKEVERVKAAWRISLSGLMNGWHRSGAQIDALKEMLDGRRGPGIAARRTIYGKVGSLPRGWARDVFNLPPR